MEHKKWYQNRNLWIIACLVVLIAAAFGIAFLQKPSPAMQESPLGTDDPGISQEEPVAYVLCRLPSSGYVGIVPLPSEGSISYPIRQTLADGTLAENVLHLTPEGFCMESSTCPNQDCVHQGVVTLDNRETRILQSSVICLPNQVIAELYSAAEIAEMDIPEASAADNHS